MTDAHEPPHAVLLLGSPSPRSRSASLARHALALLQCRGWHTSTLALNELPAEALLAADHAAPALRQAVAKVNAAQLVLVATPIYKAAYSGLLKAFLDLLPQDPLAQGGHRL